MNPLFAEQNKVSPAKSADWLRAGRHVFQAYCLPLFQITHRHTGVLDVGAGGRVRLLTRSWLGLGCC